MDYPTVSVIIPVYNAEECIEKCIKSVLLQSVPVREIIVINDGSTDNTGQILKRLTETTDFPRIIIISQPNSGQSKARNKGIVTATGDWISFLDSDDVWLHNKNELQLKFISRNNNVVLLGSQLKGSHDKRNLNRQRSSGRVLRPSFPSVLFKNPFFTSTIMIKREVLVKYMFNETKRFCEDYQLWLEVTKYHESAVLKEGLVVYADNEPLYNRNSLSSKLWEMEKGELEVYFYLFRKHKLSLILLISASLFSIIKYLRRLFKKTLCI